MNGDRAVWKVAAITALAAALRLYHLDAQSLWNDEASAVVIARGGLSQVINYLGAQLPGQPFELNPPGYFSLLHVWVAAFGIGEFQARLLSVIAGVVAVPLLFVVARHIYDEATGLWAAALLSVSQFGVMYSQEARAYEMVLVFFLATIYFYLIAVSRRSLLAWCSFVASAILMMATHYYSALAVAALGVFTLLDRSLPWSWVVGASGVGLAVAALWYRVVFAAQLVLASRPAQPPWFAVRWSTIITTLTRFSNGGLRGVLDPVPRPAVVAGAILFGGPALLMLWRAWRTHDRASQAERRSTTFVLLLWAIPVVAGYILAAILRVQYDPRYVAYAIAPFYVHTAAGLVRLRPRTLRLLAGVAVFAYSAFALRANYFFPYKENYRDAIAMVAAQATPSDCHVFVPFGDLPFQWSLYGAPEPVRRLTLDQDPDSAASCPRIWIYTYSRVIVPAHEQWPPWLSSATRHHTKTLDRQFHWMSVERYDATNDASSSNVAPLARQ